MYHDVMYYSGSLGRHGQGPLRFNMLSVHEITANFPVETVPKGTVLLRRSIIGDCIHYIESGHVGLGLMGDDAGVYALGNELSQVERHGWLGMTCAALGQPSVLDAVAQTSVQFRRIPLDYFRMALKECPAYVKTIFETMCQAQRNEQVRVLSRITQDVDSRIAAWLWTHARTNSEGAISVHLHRKREIARELGLAPESLSRSLGKLRNMGLVAGSGRDVNIVNSQGLRHCAGIDALN